MKAGVYNIHVDQGTDFSLTISLTDASGEPVNLVGYSAEMHVRRDIDAATTLVELSTSNGRIALGADGSITLTMSSSVTRTITRSGVYDIELTSTAGLKYRPLRGDFILVREVTR